MPSWRWQASDAENQNSTYRLHRICQDRIVRRSRTRWRASCRPYSILARSELFLCCQQDMRRSISTRCRFAAMMGPLRTPRWQPAKSCPVYTIAGSLCGDQSEHIYLTGFMNFKKLRGLQAAPSATTFTSRASSDTAELLHYADPVSHSPSSLVLALAPTFCVS